MASERQLEANRKNAQHSTGPRTTNGKARVASNALKDGLTGKQIVLPNENPDEFEAFRIDLLNDLNPLGALEATLAEKIVADAWRLRRVALLESAIYARGHFEYLEEKVRSYEDGTLLASLGPSDHDREAHAKASARLEEARSKLDDAAAGVTRVLEKYAPVFATFGDTRLR